MNSSRTADNFPSLFHAGELAIQERLGVREQVALSARSGLRDYLPTQHRQFYKELSFLFFGALDRTGQPWASILVGEPGFMTTPDARNLRIASRTLPGDPLTDQLAQGDFIGGLGLMPTVRRRNRVNGVISKIDSTGLTIAVQQSFGNCPQYIQSRKHREDMRGVQEPQTIVSEELSTADRLLISRADTFFIASANTDLDAGSARGVDISHRGGRPGFVRIDDDRTLTAPDFIGNFMFNTIGNLLKNPRAGLLFVDFESGDLLHLAVAAEIIWEGPQLQSFAGAERLYRFHVLSVHRNVCALPFTWSQPEPASQLPRTGTWQEANQAFASLTLKDSWRRFAVDRIHDESKSIRSFYFKPLDGLGVAPHRAGQYLSLRAQLPGQTGMQQRNYTVSDAANGVSYRISVKRDGAFSGWLHDHLNVGDEIELRPARGEFTFDTTSRRPVVLISAGVGITPMIAMLNSLLVNNDRTLHPYAIHFIHAARDHRDHAFADHVRDLASRHWNLSAHVRYSGADAESDDDGEVAQYNVDTGRVDIEFLKQVLPFDDYDFYLCGPSGFMQSLHEGLRAMNIMPGRIHQESFGPAHHPTVSIEADALQGAENATVKFTRSNQIAKWDSSKGTLLEFAESLGIAAEYGCRSGACGSCAVPLLKGEIQATRTCECSVVAGQVLMCSSIPKVRSTDADEVGGNDDGVDIEIAL